jgi:hypothetical protein
MMGRYIVPFLAVIGFVLAVCRLLWQSAPTCRSSCDSVCKGSLPLIHCRRGHHRGQH